MALPIARQQTDGLVPHSDPCASNVGSQLHAAYKNQKSLESCELVLGDFNGRVWSDFQSWRSVIGLHGMGNCNGNGESLHIQGLPNHKCFCAKRH